MVIDNEKLDAMNEVELMRMKVDATNIVNQVNCELHYRRERANVAAMKPVKKVSVKKPRATKKKVK